MSVAVTSEGILSQVLREFGKLPLAITHPYAVQHPNEKILLYEGDFMLRDSAAEYPVHGRVTFDWLPTPGPRFEGTARGIFEGGLRPMTLSIPELNLVGDAHVGRLGLTSGTNSFPISGRLLGATWVGENETADEIRFLLPNFRDYFGQQVRHDAGADLSRIRRVRPGRSAGQSGVGDSRSRVGADFPGNDENAQSPGDRLR